MAVQRERQTRAPRGARTRWLDEMVAGTGYHRKAVILPRPRTIASTPHRSGDRSMRPLAGL